MKKKDRNNIIKGIAKHIARTDPITVIDAEYTIVEKMPTSVAKKITQVKAPLVRKTNTD